ncbi:MAG: Holliday junction resolvase RuvX [Pseudomonadota bacterium]
MPIIEIKTASENKRQGCPKNVRLMGLDLGEKTIGVAISDTAQSLATPVETIIRTKFSKDVEALAKIIREYEVKAYILGWPLNMDGSESKRCGSVRSFADEMLNKNDVFGHDAWIGLWDERLSTQAVEENVDSRVDISKKSKRASKEQGLTDKLAAQFILQGWLDFL